MIYADELAKAGKHSTDKIGRISYLMKYLLIKDYEYNNSLFRMDGDLNLYTVTTDADGRVVPIFQDTSLLIDMVNDMDIYQLKDVLETIKGNKFKH